jgi:hypothetical protein
MTHKRWGAMSKVVKKLREGGWFTPKELFEAMKKDEEGKAPVLRSVYGDLELGTSIGIFKKHKEKHAFAWIDYQEDEPLILKATEEYLDNHHELRDGKRPLSPFDLDQIIDLAVLETAKPKKEIEAPVRKFIKKYFERRG